MRIKLLIVSGILSLALSAGAQELANPYASPQDSVEYRHEIETLIQVSGAEKALDIILPQMKSMIESRLVQGEGRAQALAILDEFFSQFTEDMVDIITPIYRKYFTAQDIKDVNAFYTSPVGRKFFSVMGEISKDALQAGQEYAQEKMWEAIRRLEEKKLLIEI